MSVLRLEVLLGAALLGAALLASPALWAALVEPDPGAEAPAGLDRGLDDPANPP